VFSEDGPPPAETFFELFKMGLLSHDLALMNTTSIRRAAPGKICNTRFATALLLLIAGMPWELAAQASITQQAYLKANTVRSGGEFGAAVGISGDTAVVGSGHEAAYVYVRRGATWTFQTRLTASNPGSMDYFGNDVGISGDTIVVSARSEDSNATGVNGNQNNNSATDSGAAYVFVRNGTTWVQQAYLKASNARANTFFGPCAISGNTIVIASAHEGSDAQGVNGDQNNIRATGSGAAYVFVREDGVWSQQAYLKASNSQSGDIFGNELAISGDTIVVGAPGEDSNVTGVNGDQSNNSGPGSGAAYVFVRDGTTWSQQAYLKASNRARDFGGFRSVGVSGDIIVVGAPPEASNSTGVNGNQSNTSAIGSGAAYVFARNGTTWTQQAYLKASNTGADDAFGRVAVSGRTIVVAAFWEDSNATGINGNQLNNSATDAGAAYVFEQDGTTWRQRAYLKASNTGAGDWLGQNGVAISDGTALIGAVYEDSNATGVNGNQTNNSSTDSGAAYVFTIPETPPVLTVAPTPGGVRLLWPSFGSSWLLERSGQLEAAAEWFPIPPPYQSDASGFSLTLPIDASGQFFRLRKP
jgi:hypothetical protein